MTTVATLRQLVITLIPEANDMLIDRVLVEVAREFCNKTRVLRRNVTGTVTAGTLSVTLTPPTDAELVDIVSATLDDNKLERKTTAQLDAINPKWRTDSGGSDYITLSDDMNDVLVAPLSATTYTSGLVVRGSWRPVLGATTFDDRLVSDYSDALLAGAYGRLYSSPGAPWANGDLAGFYMRSYLEQMADAQQAATDSNMTGVVRKIKYGGL